MGKSKLIFIVLCVALATLSIFYFSKYQRTRVDCETTNELLESYKNKSDSLVLVIEHLNKRIEVTDREIVEQEKKIQSLLLERSK